MYASSGVNKKIIPMQHFTMRWQNHALELGRRTAVMGIVNVTPDSFSDGGQFLATRDGVTHGEEMVAAGADIIDIGGESTRPYADEVTAQEEMDRVLPVIEQLAQCIPVPISIDTTKAQVAKAAVEAGAAMINDISALGMDPQMASTAAQCGVPLILMHILGSPRTMQVDPWYEDLIDEVHLYLEQAIAKAVSAGVDPGHIIIDPGIGFGKTLDHNLTLLNCLDAFTDLNVPILVGPSRKTFIRKILSADMTQELSPDSPEVETGTQAAVAASVLNGAHIVRVHNVANTKAMVRMLDAIRNVK